MGRKMAAGNGLSNSAHPTAARNRTSKIARQELERPAASEGGTALPLSSTPWAFLQGCTYVKDAADLDAVYAIQDKYKLKRDEKEWHFEERSFGSFYRSMSLPFTPKDDVPFRDRR